ncbi:Chloroquine resistance marker protein [Plasmodium coatneyi]|uniref:Chloroquine resistance marker protein n=1 Tax=Plasmodium coatneyi TaxID=208452 RepID=A0A1B1E415_9APIC|nr:Chloroquine resistance marker protein [Plasmodium coatneyi]ANQ09731.1 Chloroquine resistance marker protein [Plasmodium coatneyi]
MFQKFLSDILNKVLGTFIYGIDDEQFGISDLLSGKLELTNIHLKQSVVDMIDIPCRLNFGCIGYFKINLPIFYFMKNPINVYIEDVILVLSTIPPKYFDDKLYKEKYIENKKNLLLSSEYRAIVCSIEGGVIWQMLLSAINNINISVKNVHIRIEDFTSNPSSCFSFGISVEELFLSLPKDGLPIKRDGYYTKKNELVNNTMINMITIKKLGFYMDYLDMKKIMNRKYHTQWDNLYMNNSSSFDVASHQEKKDTISRGKRKKRKKKGDKKGEKHSNNATHRRRNKGEHLNKVRNIKSNEENLNDFQDIIKNVKNSFSGTRRNELDVKSMSKFNQKIHQINKQILRNDQDDHKKSKHDPIIEGSLTDTNADNASSCLGKKDGKCSLSISNFYNFNLFSKKEEKILPVKHNLGIDNDVSWVACITKFSESLENPVLKGKKNEMIKRKRKRNENMNRKNDDFSLHGEQRKNHLMNIHSPVKHPSNDAKEEGQNYLNKAVSFFSLNSFTNVINKNLINRTSNRSSDDVVSPTNEIIISDGYFTTRENGSDPDSICRNVYLGRDTSQRGNTPFRDVKKQKRYVRVQNRRTYCGANKYHYAVDDCKQNSDGEGGSPFFVNRDSTVCLNFASDPEMRTSRGRRGGMKRPGDAQRRSQSYVAAESESQFEKEEKFTKYVKKNEIKEKIRTRKRKKIQSVYLMYEKTYKISKEKLNTFYLFLQLIKNIKHEYVINPNCFEGYGEIYLSLIPTDHGRLPFARCFSSWGIQRRSEKEFEECLPKLSVFITLKNIKIIFSDKQILNFVKWINLNFVTYSVWKAGILSQFEKVKADNEDEIAYINKWVLKLLDTHTSKEEKLDAERFCEQFENNHSINIINLLRSKAFCKLQEFRKEVELRGGATGEDTKNIPNGGNNDGEAHNLTNIDEVENGAVPDKASPEEDHANSSADGNDNQLKQVANESIHVLKLLMKNQKVYNKIKNSFREKIFTIDICIDICIINSTCLVTVETCNQVNNRTVNFVKTYALLMQCIHYHNQISNTHELKNSMDLELYPLTLLLVVKNLDNKYIKPDINVLYILTNAGKKDNYENYHKKFLFNVDNFEFLKKYNLLKRDNKRRNDYAKVGDRSDTLNFGSLRQKLKFLVEDNFFFFPKRDNNIYCNELNNIILSDPSIYLRYDNQSYTILEKPDHRLFLHNCADSIFNINGEIVKSFIDDYFHFCDVREVLSKKKEETVSYKKEYFLQLGARYCNDILDNYTTHTNLFLDVELEKILSFVITKSGKGSEVQGYSLNLNPVKIVTQLTQRMVCYDESVTNKNVYDSFFVQFDGIKVRRILNWDHAARNYKTYLDENFIRPYRILFHSKSKVYFDRKEGGRDKFSFNLNRGNGLHRNSHRGSTFAWDGEVGVSKSDASSQSHTSQGSNNEQSHPPDETQHNDNNDNNPYNSIDKKKKSEIFNLKRNENYSDSEYSSLSNYKQRKSNKFLRSTSCPAVKNRKNASMEQARLDVEKSNIKGASYNIGNLKGAYCMDKTYSPFFFKTCANEYQEEDEMLVNHNFLDMYKKSSNDPTYNDKDIQNSYSYINEESGNYDKSDDKSSNYVFSMSEKASCTIHLCHLKFNPKFPMFICKLNEENMYINICDYDVEFFFLIFSYIYGHYNTQQMENKKRNIFFLKEKIKSMCKLNQKYYKAYANAHKDKPVVSLFRKSGAASVHLKRRHPSRSKETHEMATNSDTASPIHSASLNAKVKKRRKKLKAGKFDQRDDTHAEAPQEDITIDGEKKKKRKSKKRDKSGYSLRKKKSSIFKLAPYRKGRTAEVLRSPNEILPLEGKYSRQRRETLVGYLSDSHVRTTQELSISKLREDLAGIFGEGTDHGGLENHGDYFVTEGRMGQVDAAGTTKCNQQDKQNGNQLGDSFTKLSEQSDDSLLWNGKNLTEVKKNYRYSGTSSPIGQEKSQDERKDKLEKVKKKKKKKREKKRETNQMERMNNHLYNGEDHRTQVSSDDDSWVELLENYDSDESLDDNEKIKVKKMLEDIENIKKRLAHNNFSITCSFSLSIKKIFIRFWKRKSPLKGGNKSNEFRSPDTFQLTENGVNLENKVSSIFGRGKNKAKLSIAQDEDEHIAVEEGDNTLHNLTRTLREHEMNDFHRKDNTNLTVEESKDDLLYNKNFIALNENMQKNMFNNMQYAIPLCTFIFSDIFFVAKVEKNNFTYILYSMNGVDVRDETNITLLSMSSIYHSDLKFVNRSEFGTDRVERISGVNSRSWGRYKSGEKLPNGENFLRSEKSRKIERVNRTKEKGTSEDPLKSNEMIETEDTFLDYSISNIELPDLEKTHLVLLYFGYLFKNNHTFKFILNRTKVKIFWEIIDEFLTWFLSINELLPQMNTIEEDINRKLEDSEDIHLDYLQKVQHINYDVISIKHSNTIVSGNGTYKIAVDSLINRYSVMFQCNEMESSPNGEEHETVDAANEDEITYIDAEDDPMEKYYLITEDKSICSNQYNTIIIENEEDINTTLKEILLHENYFFNYTFNKINKKKNIEKILTAYSVKGDLHKGRQFTSSGSHSIMHGSSSKWPPPNEQLLQKKNYPPAYHADNTKRGSIPLNDLDELNTCHDCLHSKNLDYTAYTKEVCKSKAYPYVHVDIEINYFELWVALDPVRVPQKRKNSYLLSEEANKAYPNGGKNVKRRQTRKTSLVDKAKEWKKNSISSRTKKGADRGKKKRKGSDPYSRYEMEGDGSPPEGEYPYGEYPNGECLSDKHDNHEDGEKRTDRFKFREKMKWCKGANIDKPYVLATKGCLKSVIFFLLYKESLEERGEEKEAAREYSGDGSNRNSGDDSSNNGNEGESSSRVRWLRDTPTKEFPQGSQTVSNNSSNPEKKNNPHDQMEALKIKVMDALGHSNLNKVLDANDFVKSTFMQWIIQVSSYLPCILNMNIFLSQITSAISRPVTRSPFLRAYIDWNNVPYNNILLQPCRVNLNFEMKIPSPEMLIQRCLGINKITSIKIAQKDSLLVQNEVEGIDVNCSFEPIIMNVDSNALTLLNQLCNILLDFSTYFFDLCSSKEKEEEEDFLIRGTSTNDNFYDHTSDLLLSDSFYFNVMDASTSAMSSAYSLSDADSPLSKRHHLEEEIRSFKKDELSRLFVSFCLTPEGKTHSNPFGGVKSAGGDNLDGVKTFRTVKSVIASQNEKNRFDLPSREHLFRHNSENHIVKKKDDMNMTLRDSNERVKSQTDLPLDSNTLNMLMMNFVENIKMNCNVNFDVIILQVWDSNTAYNRCSLNFVIEYFSFHLYSLNIYEQSVEGAGADGVRGGGNSQLLDDQRDLSPGRSGKDGITTHCLGDDMHFEPDIRLGRNSEVSSNRFSKIGREKNAQLEGASYEEVYSRETSHRVWARNGERGSASTPPELKRPNENKSQIYMCSKSDEQNDNRRGTDITREMDDITNAMTPQGGEIPPDEAKGNHLKNDLSDSNQCGEENKGWRKLFNRKNFIKNIELFYVQIKKIFQKIFFKKKETEMVQLGQTGQMDRVNRMESNTKHNFSKLKNENRKYQNGNQIFMNNEYMFTDLKNYNENKKSKNVECKIEFLVYCENFNKKENSYQTFVEPVRVEIIAVKKDLTSPIHLYYYFSWLNINLNFNILDNILSLCCSVIFSIITQRTRLLLGRHINEIDKKRNMKKLPPGGKNDKNEELSSKNVHTNNVIYQTEYEDNNTEKKNISEMDDTYTSMCWPKCYAVMHDEQYKDIPLLTNDHILFRYNKFDVLHSVNRSLDTYIFGEFILEKLLRNYQYSCQYPGDYLAKYENEFNVDKSDSASEQLIHIKLFNYIKRKKRLEMNNICKINNLLGQPIAICTIQEESDLSYEEREGLYSEARRNSFGGTQYCDNKQSLLLSTIDRISRKKLFQGGVGRHAALPNSGITNRDRQNHPTRSKRTSHAKGRRSSDNRSPGGENTLTKEKEKNNYSSDPNDLNADHTDTSTTHSRNALKYQWKILSNNESLDLPTHKNGKVKFFLIRFRLLNYIYDIPSSILNTRNENEDIIRLVIPERRLPPNINAQVEEELYNEQLLEMDNLSVESNYHTLYPSNYTSKRNTNTNKEEVWKPANIPQPRNHLFIFFRTSSRISHEEKQEYDFFLSSIVAVKNNTDFPLYVFKSVPGNSNRNGIFKEYFHKYNTVPSPPPTYTLKIDKKIEKFIQHSVAENNTLSEEKKKKKTTSKNDVRSSWTNQMNSQNNPYHESTNNKEKAINYIQHKSYLYGRKCIKNIFPLMKLSSVEHYISGDIKFSSLAPLKYKRKKRKKGRKSKQKHELQKRFIKRKIKEIYLKKFFKKSKHKRISKYENGLLSREKFRDFSGQANPYRNIMSINDSFFSFAKRSSQPSASSSASSAASSSLTSPPLGVAKNTSTTSVSMTDLSNITLSSLSNSIFSMESTPSNSSAYGNSLCDYDKDNSEEQALLNEYFKKEQANAQGGLDLIKISSNSNKLIPIPLYWLVAENSFIWLSIQNEKIYKQDLYDFLNDHQNADYMCTKGTLDNMLNYHSPFLADTAKAFKPSIIRLRNHLLKENNILTKEGNKNNPNLSNSYNLNYMNLKEVYFTSTIISVYNPNYVLHKKDAHNFFQISIDHALMINNGLPRTMCLTYEVLKPKSTKSLKKSTSTYTTFPSVERSNRQKTYLATDESLSVVDSYVRRTDESVCDRCCRGEEFASSEQLQSSERLTPSDAYHTAQTDAQSTSQERCNTDGVQDEDVDITRNEVENFTDKYPQNRDNKSEQRKEDPKRSILFSDNLKEKKTNLTRITHNGEIVSMKDKEILLKEVNNDKNVFIYKNKKKENSQNAENTNGKIYMEETNFIVTIKKEGNKDIHEIRIDPGQNIKLPFVPHNINISFDGYNSRSISINYPHKKGREKIILEKEVKEDMASFFSLDYREEGIPNYGATVGSSPDGSSASGGNYSEAVVKIDQVVHSNRITHTNYSSHSLDNESSQRGKMYANARTVALGEIKDYIKYGDLNNVKWKNDQLQQKRETYKSSKTEEGQKQLTIWAIFNEFYETGKNRYQDISLEKIHHATYSVSCTFFVSACVINRLNYPITLKRINNDNMIVIEPYVRKLLPCEFAMRRNRVVISYETLKEVKNWINYPLKKFMIKRKKLKRTRNIIKKKNHKIVSSSTLMQNEQIKSEEIDNQQIEGEQQNSGEPIQNDISEKVEPNHIHMISKNRSNLFHQMKRTKGNCFFYRSNINKPLESEDFRITDLSITRLTCSNKNKNVPQLKYSVYMSIAPMPFFRTTVMEILPYIVIINNTKMNIVFQEYIKNYTYFKYNILEPGAFVEFHPQSKKKAMLKICGIFENSFNYLIDDYLQKELYLENLEKENEKLLGGIKEEDCAREDDSKTKGDFPTGGNPLSNCNLPDDRGIAVLPLNDISDKLSVLVNIERENHHMFHQQSSSSKSTCSTSAQNSLEKDGVERANQNDTRPNDMVKKYKKVDAFKFLYWSEVLDLTRVSMIYFRHPVVSNENFKKEEKKLKKLNLLLKNHGKNDVTYLNISKELLKTSSIPYEYTCCSMEISTYKGCKFVRFQDIDVVPFYLLNLTKYNIKLRQLGIYEHSEVLRKIPKKKKKSFDEIFKNYAFNFSFYNPYKDPKLKVSILSSSKKNEQNKKEKKGNKSGHNNSKSKNNLRYANTLKINLKNELNYLSLLATNYLKDNEYAKIINDKIFHLKRFSEQVENLNDGNLNIIDLANSTNVTLLKLRQGDAFVYILCSKKTYNGKTIFSFENYDDLISNVLNFRSASLSRKNNYKLLKSLHVFSNKIKNAYFRGRNKKQDKRKRSRKGRKDSIGGQHASTGEYTPNGLYAHGGHEITTPQNRAHPKKRQNANRWHLLNLFRKRSTTRSVDKGPRITHLIRDLYEKKMINREEKKKDTLNLNIFAHFIFKGVGLSINNHNLEEILYFSMEYILVVYKQINDKDLFHLKIGWLQIDNHTKNTDYKNVLLPIIDLKKSHQVENSTQEQNEDRAFLPNGGNTFVRKLRTEDMTILYRSKRGKSNDTFSHHIRDENEYCKMNSRNILRPVGLTKNKSCEDYSYFEKDNLLISPNTNNPLSNSYKMFIPSFFYAQHNSVLDVIIVKQKRGNMKNFLELSDVNIKLSPLSINVDSYFIIEILKIFDELLKILEYDLTNYNSLNLEKNIELRDTDYDSLEYKQNMGPVDELIKHYILKDYHLYEQIANFKFNDIRNEQKEKEKKLTNKRKKKTKKKDGEGSHDETTSSNIFHSNRFFNKSDNEVPDVRTYISMINEYKNWGNRGDQAATGSDQDGHAEGTDPLGGLNKQRRIPAGNTTGNCAGGRKDTMLKHTSGVPCPGGYTHGEEEMLTQITTSNNRKRNNLRSNYNSDNMYNEKKLKYLQSCEKYYKNLLNNRKRILKKIQNINMKNNLISFDKIFISKLEINEIKLIINIKNRILSYDKKSEIMESNVMNALVVLIMNIPNISDAHLHFEKEVKKNMCGSLYVLIFNEIMNDYINPGMNQMFNVLGAVDFIGNPLIIYKHWKKGYNTFIKDLKKSLDSCSFPFLFGILLLNILGRFGRSLLSGILEGVSRLCGSWSTCFERFSRNADNFSIVTNSNVLQNEILDQPSNCAEGICYGCQSFVNILTISCVNTIYKPFMAIKKIKGFRKKEKDKFKIFLSVAKLMFYGLFSAFSSLFFGLFNSILSFFTFLFIGTLNQIQTVTMKSVVRPKKMSVIKEYAKFVNYEYPLSFSNHIINEKKKKKEFLKRNIVAVIPLYSFKDNNASSIKSFLWVSNKEVGYCQRDKLLWSLFTNCIIKVDILLIQVDHGQGKKKLSILSRNKNKIKSKRSNFSTRDKEDDQPVKTKWNFHTFFYPQKYRQLGDFKPSYYIRILYRSVHKVKRSHRKPKFRNFSFRKKDDSIRRLKQIMRKNTYERYFDKQFRNEQLDYQEADQGDNPSEADKGDHHDRHNGHHKYRHTSNHHRVDNHCDHDRRALPTKLCKTHHKVNNYYTKNYARGSTQNKANRQNDVEEDVLHDGNNYCERERKYPSSRPSSRVGKGQKLRDDTLPRGEKKSRLKKKGMYPYQQKDVNISEDSREMDKLKHKKKHARKHHTHKKKNFLYISKLVKCESKEVALHAFSLLLSFLVHKSPYYLKTAN